MGFEDVFIVGYARTPFGSFQGALSTKDACELGAIALKAALKNAKVDTQLVEELVMGCALTAGLGQAPATRVAALAGLPTTTSSYVISKVCASGTKAIQLASNSVKTGMSHIVAAGGMESMSRAPFLLPTNCRNGLKFGDHNLIDSLLHDGLTDSMTGVSMGKCGEDCAHENGITREAADDFAIRSYQRTIENTSFLAEEIIPVDSFMGPDERLSSVSWFFISSRLS